MFHGTMAEVYYKKWLMPNAFLESLNWIVVAIMMQAPKSERKKKAKKRSDSWYRFLIFVAGLLLLCGPVDALSNLANSLGDLIEKSLSF